MKSVIDYRVPYADTDQMAVVYYGNYLTYFERCRNELLRDSGITYKEFEQEGFMLPVLEAHCNYHNSAKYDDLLQITAEVTELKKASLTIHCEVICNGNILVSGYTKHACISAETRRVCRFPSNIFSKLTKAFDNE